MAEAKQLWKNTKTLDSFLPSLEARVVDDPSLAEVALLGAGKFDIDSMPSLQMIFRCGVGTENIPFEVCEERGIRVVLPSDRTRMLIFEETSSFAAYLVLSSLYSDVGDVTQWKKYDRPALSSRVVLVLGRGNIGKRVIAKLEPFCRVTSWDPAQDEGEELDALLGTADVVTLHMPLNPSTEGWFDGSMMDRMKTGAWLVNTARAGIVPERDLAERILQGRLQAAFDVFWKEPYSGDLARLDPDIFRMSPHVSSHSGDFLQSLAGDLTQALALGS